MTADLNAARPITAGGTGATTAVGAADNFSPAFVDVASATTCDIGAAASPNVNITGTTTITGFGTKTAGVKRYVKFAGALTLTHNATSLILPGAANITTAAGDTAALVSEGSGNWRMLWYQRAAQEPFVVNSLSIAQCWAYITVSAGSPVIAASYNIASITDTGVGRCTVTIDTDFGGINWTASVSVLSSGSTTVFPNYLNKAAGSITLTAISLADAFTDPDAYDFIGFGAQ
ncbi:MAG: hypothetical protein RLW68_00780 [Devosia marina]|uniref:hypothetical protein n=1 Tax=Devosia marina TaxID=2683198 RepID=UPI0032EE88F1